MIGGDTFPYGIEENRPTLEQFARYTYEQGIAHRHASLFDCCGMLHLVEAFVIRKRDEVLVGQSEPFRVMIE